MDISDQPFSALATLTQGSALKPMACDILILELGLLHLELLELEVDLSAIQLDIKAQSGQGKLLGNQLCSLAGTLNGTGTLLQAASLVEEINDLL